MEPGLLLTSNYSRNLNGSSSDSYLQALTLPRIPVEGLSADSHSPVTPHDLQVIVSGQEKSAPTWATTISPPCGSRSLGGGSHIDLGSSLSESDIDLNIDFATLHLPPFSRRYERPSLSTSDLSDYHSREVPRHRDIGDINTPPVSEDHEHQNGRSSRGPSSSSENDGHTAPLVYDNPLSRSRANQPSSLDWSDARPGGVTPSWDGRSHGEP